MINYVKCACCQKISVPYNKHVTPLCPTCYASCYVKQLPLPGPNACKADFTPLMQNNTSHALDRTFNTSTNNSELYG